MTKQTIKPSIPVLPHVGAMASYALADLSVPDDKKRIMLAQNESLRPPSPAVGDAVIKAMQEVHYYPDADWSGLRAAIASVHQVPEAQILCGAGSMELIGALGQAYVDANNRILTTEYGYAYFRTVAKMRQAGLDLATETDFTVSVDALLAVVQPDTRLVFLANPGNPTGTRIGRTEIMRLRDGLADDVLLVVDEAYGEFADHLQEPVFDLVERGNTIVLRTLSKAYGLAGVRAGWGLFPIEIAVQVRKLLNPNNISLGSQAAATVAMSDQAYMRETVAETAIIRERFTMQMRALGLVVPESFTNFVLVCFPDQAGAVAADQALRAEGVVARGMGVYGLGHCLRVTIGAADEMALAAGVVEQSCNS